LAELLLDLWAVRRGVPLGVGEQKDQLVAVEVWLQFRLVLNGEDSFI
jgi:hypothetical protein